MDTVKKLRQIDQRLAQERQALRAIDEEQRNARDEVEDAEAALADHFAQEHVDELEPRDLHAKLAAARNRAEQPWQQRRVGKQRLVHKLEAERAQFVNDHLGELAASREHDAYAACDAVINFLEGIEAAERGYVEVEQWYANLLRPVPGVNGRDIPSLDLSALKNEVQRALERGIRPPLPQSLYGTENADP